MEKSELLKSVGKRIQKIRNNKGLTQVELVGKINGEIDTTNISRIEAGRTNPTIFTLYRISEALEVKLSDLVDIVLIEE
ncbi:helix-turn-helix domain-containing protein [Chryseobacterium lathyri]|uniref:helix-turn-helix domain-containing protein n=1 Tax=Chryseobacterium lathyri TaxID=395933 RepID=UPI00277D6A8F|nr:helix-turn-helix transcriptional regulator [Chryseobacterium lathyri]MDQ0066776.1 transcriptional regulator with XRE-family HTH domain [Chryseobacterium lathyri]